MPDISSRSELDSVLFRAGSGGIETDDGALALLTRSDQLPDDDRKILRMLGRLPCFCGEDVRLSGGDVTSGTIAEKDDRDVGYWMSSKTGVNGVVGEIGGELKARAVWVTILAWSGCGR